MLKKIHIVINPGAGNDEPVLSYLNDALKDSKITWDVSITKKSGDANAQAKEAIAKGVDAVVSYGGDGTVMEIAQALHKSDTPLFILPGGTTNVFAKELGMPTDTQEALEILKNQSFETRHIDMGMANENPFLIRVSFGLPAEVINNTEREEKDKLGMAAYYINTIKNLIHPHKQYYKIDIDGEKIEAEGVALVVANSGHLGIAGMYMAPEISLDDGLLDVLLITEADVSTLLEIAKSTIAQKTTHALKQWKGKVVSIAVDPVQHIAYDDLPMMVKELKMTIIPKSLKVLVPLKSQSK